MSRTGSDVTARLASVTRATRFSSVAIVVAVVCTACSGAASDPAAPRGSATPDPASVDRGLPEPTNRLEEVVVYSLTAQRSKPMMSDEQVATLWQILDSGEVTYEQYADAVNRTLECATEVGLSIDGPRPGESLGQPVLVWGWNDPTQPDGDPMRGEQCRLTHSAAIEDAYLNTGSAVEDERQQLEAFRPALLACLDDHGVAPEDPGMDVFDLLDYAAEMYVSTDWVGEACAEAVQVAVDL